MARFLAFLLFVPAAFGQNPAPAALPAGVEELSVNSGGKERKFLLLSPPGDQADPVARFPVLLFLHGAGERGSDNRVQLKHFPEKMAAEAMRREFPCFLIAPQCELNQQWVNAPWGDKTAKPMADQPGEMLAYAMACLDWVMKDKADRIDPARVYVTGLSMGGYGTWEIAARRPDLFAAAAPVCGGGDENQAAKLKDLPIWAFHGDKDTVVWPVRSEAMIAAVKQVGGQPKLTLLPGVGHNAWSTAYDPKSGLLTWLFAQKKAEK